MSVRRAGALGCGNGGAGGPVADDAGIVSPDVKRTSAPSFNSAA